VIVIALNSVAPSRTPAPEHQPDFYVGAAHLLHGALGDPLAQDIRTLANTNALIAAGLPATNGHSRRRHEQPGGPGEPGEPVAPVPYIFIAPENPSAIGEIAQRVYRKHYSRPWKPGTRDLWLLGKILDAGAAAMHGELLSYVFFAGEFAEELIAFGRADAQRWLDQHPSDLWQLDPLPAWSPAPNGDTSALCSPQPARARALAAARELATAAHVDTGRCATPRSRSAPLRET
jgi:NTE family protein